VLVVSPYPGLYLLTALKPRTPHSYFDPGTDPDARLWAHVRALADSPANLPDVIVDYREQLLLSVEPVRPLLDRYYRPLAPGRAQLYLRRDIPAPPVPCPCTLTFDHAPPGAGWGPVFPGTNGWPPFAWMADREATLRLPRPDCPGPLRLRIEAAFGVADDVLDSLALRVNGRDVPLTAAALPPAGRAYEAVLSQDVLSASQDHLDLQLSVNRTAVLPGCDRPLAIGFRNLVLSDGERGN
jgi:hypothetical protein